MTPLLAWLAALAAGTVALPESVSQAIAIAGQQPETSKAWQGRPEPDTCELQAWTLW
jgi:hypothetical protein